MSIKGTVVGVEVGAEIFMTVNYTGMLVNITPDRETLKAIAYGQNQ